MTEAYVVVIGTAGNQRYIFSSNKRQEVVGASELIARVDGRWAEEALAAAFPGFDPRWRIEERPAELVLAGAGGVTALARERDAGRRLVAELTRRALAQAPGLDVCGVVTGFDWDRPGGLADATRRAHTALPAVREERSGPDARHQRLPVVDECAASGLPAAELRAPAADERPQPRSAASVAKLGAYEDALLRLAADSGQPTATDEQRRTARKAMRAIVDHLGDEADWVAVVHADGNGLGEMFQRFEDLVPDSDQPAYVDALRGFSRGVDECARKAFRAAMEQTRPHRPSAPPEVLPLVLGGDDFIAVCDAAVALPFTRRYLEAFAAETARHPGTREVLRARGIPALGAAAGVAIVKRHYPFHFAHELAEELTAREAKRVKEWVGSHGCAISFCVLYESAPPDLGRLRGGGPADVRLSACPYLLGETADGPWARGRRWDDLVRRVDSLTRRDEETGERLVPRGAAHELREGVTLGRNAADARFGLLRNRFTGDPRREDALRALSGDDGSLFWTDGDGGATTSLLDAMDAAGLPGGEEVAG